MAIQELTERTPVRDAVVKHPVLRDRFEQLGIDYCCGGERTLREAALSGNVDPTALLGELNVLLSSPSEAAVSARNWSTARFSELLDHIVARHHTFMKEQLPRLEVLLEQVCGAHGKGHGSVLNELRDVFATFKEEIDEHLAKEEMVLFPAIRRLEDRGLQAEMLAGPIGQMEYEHKNAGQALDRMRSVTREYELPPEACPTFAALYDGLRAVEADLHEHIHLENNILFPRVAIEAGRLFTK